MLHADLFRNDGQSHRNWATVDQTIRSDHDTDMTTHNRIAIPSYHKGAKPAAAGQRDAECNTERDRAYIALLTGASVQGNAAVDGSCVASHSSPITAVA